MSSPGHTPPRTASPGGTVTSPSVGGTGSSTSSTATTCISLPSCLMPESFTGENDFEDYLQQFLTAARLSGWQTPAGDNRPYYFALRLKGNALHFYTTLTTAQQHDFDQLVAAFRTTYTTNVEVLKAKLKAAKQQPNQEVSAFLCDVRTLAKRIYRGQPAIEEQMVLTSFIEGLHNSIIRWELRKMKPVNPDAALALAVELHSFLEMEPSFPSHAMVNAVSAASSSQSQSPVQAINNGDFGSYTDNSGLLVQFVKQEVQKAISQTNQNNGKPPYRNNNNDNRPRNNSTNFNQNSRYGIRSNWNNQPSQQNNHTFNNRNQERSCKHCGRNNHSSRECKACFNCGKIGHFNRECTAPRQNSQDNTIPPADDLN